MLIPKDFWLPAKMPVDENIRHRNYLPTDYELGEYDVFCGRGSQCYQHVGNQHYQMLIESMLQRYVDAGATSKRMKMDIITDVIRKVRELSPHGGFIKQDLETWRYYEIGDDLAREKVSQSFRDAIRDKARPGKRKKAPTTTTTILEKKESSSSSIPRAIMASDGTNTGRRMTITESVNINDSLTMPMISRRKFNRPIPNHQNNVNNVHTNDEDLGNNHTEVATTRLRHTSAISYEQIRHYIRDEPNIVQTSYRHPQMDVAVANEEDGRIFDLLWQYSEILRRQAADTNSNSFEPNPI